MARIVKDYDERLNELLDTAQQLFFKKGYEKTSVNDIIEAVGVAKGTFYHYFKTKSDLLDRLVDRFAMQMLGEIKKLVDRNDLAALDKMNAMFAMSRNIKTDNVDLMRMLLKALYNEDNLRLHHKMIRSRITLTLPEFTKVLLQGNEEGVFDVTDPEETAELIYLLGANLNEIIGKLMLTLADHPENLDVIERKINAYEHAIEKILGVHPDSLDMVADRDFITRFLPEDDSKEK